jgi:hypothetical protein
VNVYDHDFKLRKAVLGAALGIFLGLVIFFRSESIITLILGIFAASYTLGVLGFLSENISGIRKLAVGIILLLPLVLLSIIFPLSVNYCQLHAMPGYEVKKNIFTGEVKHNEYVGDRGCADLLPWYYVKLEDKERAEKEIKNYCQDHNQSRVCRPDADAAMSWAGYH